MLQQDIAQKLSNLEIFRGLSPERLEKIARCAERMLFKPGQPIIRAQKRGEAAFLIIAGTACVESEDGSENGEELAPGTLLGELAMLTEHDYSVTVTCREQVRAVRFPRSALHAEMAEDPELAEHFVTKVASRLTRVAIELRRLDEMLAITAEGTGGSAQSAPAP
jgi:CRP/FNR family transcriptional regulator, cyclic AMP receptor protein